MTRRRSLGLARDESGVTLVEFGILLVPLLAVILGFTELAYQSYVRSVLQGTLNNVARAAAVENPNLGDAALPLQTRIETGLKARLARLVDSGTYDFKISNYQSFAGVGQPEALVTDVNGNGAYDSGDCWQDSNTNDAFDLDAGRSGVGGADDVVVYEVTLTAPHLLPVMHFLGTGDEFDVKAATMIRIQPYADQRQPEVVC